MCPPSGRDRVPAPPGGSGRIWAGVPPLRRSAYLGHPPPPGLFSEDEKYSRIKAVVAGGASGRSLRPAVRVVTGFCGVSKVGSKSGPWLHFCSHYPQTPTVATKKQVSSPVQARLYWQKRETSLFFLQRRRHRVFLENCGAMKQWKDPLIARHDMPNQRDPSPRVYIAVDKDCCRRGSSQKKCELFDNSAPCPWIFFSFSEITELYYVKKDTGRLAGITTGFEL